MAEWSQSNSNRVATVWKNLADSYGPRFLRDYGNEAPHIWATAIRGLSDPQIARGFRRLAAHGSGSCPTLPQFMKACTMPGDDEGTLRSVSTFKALPPPMSLNKYVGMGHVELLRFILKKEVPTDAVNDMRKIIDRAASDYQSISREDAVTDDEFKTYVRKKFVEHVSAGDMFQESA